MLKDKARQDQEKQQEKKTINIKKEIDKQYELLKLREWQKV